MKMLRTLLFFITVTATPFMHGMDTENIPDAAAPTEEAEVEIEVCPVEHEATLHAAARVACEECITRFLEQAKRDSNLAATRDKTDDDGKTAVELLTTTPLNPTNPKAHRERIIRILPLFVAYGITAPESETGEAFFAFAGRVPRRPGSSRGQRPKSALRQRTPNPSTPPGKQGSK